MIDVTHKRDSLRRAIAIGRVNCAPETVARIRADTLPKGNLFDIARAAGFLAAKQTQHLIPLCHPVVIDHMTIDFETDEQGVAIRVFCQAIDRTGIEVEAMTALSIAAITIFDLLKPIDKNLSITDLHIEEKRGGKSDAKRDLYPGTTATILVVSDSTARGERKDNSGVIIRERLESLGVEVRDYQIVADEPREIAAKIRAWVSEDIHFIFTTGGTGIGPRDQTVEAVLPLLDRVTDGITEAMRYHGLRRTQRAMLSRAVAGHIGRTMVVTLPGSSSGAAEGLDAILPGLFHSRSMLSGGGH